MSKRPNIVFTGPSPAQQASTLRAIRAALGLEPRPPTPSAPGTRAIRGVKASSFALDEAAEFGTAARAGSR